MRPIGDWSISTILSRNSTPSSPPSGAGCSRALLSRLASALYRVSTIRVDLPPPETPVTQQKVPSGISAVMPFRLLPRASRMRRIWPGWPMRRIGGTGICAHPGQILAGDAVRVGHDRFGRALGDDMPAMHAGARPHIDDPVGGADRLLVVLDDDDRVAEVAQPLQGREQAPVVALVQSDRRLVQHVEHPGQPRADLRGQPDALALAARQCARSARQGQVFEPDILQKAEPLVDLLQDALRRSRAGSGSARR